MDRRGDNTAGQLDLPSAARLSAAEMLDALHSSSDGLTAAEAQARLESLGPNTLQTHGVRALVAVIAAIIPTYLLVLELGKHVFYGRPAAAPRAAAPRRPPHEHRILRRAARLSHRRALA